MSWDRLTKAQQNTARHLRSDLHAAGVGTSVSQIAKHFDLVMSWRRGTVSLDDVKSAISWEAAGQ